MKRPMILVTALMAFLLVMSIGFPALGADTIKNRCHWSHAICAGQTPLERRAHGP
jgi:hypothetical protein